MDKQIHVDGAANVVVNANVEANLKKIINWFLENHASRFPGEEGELGVNSQV